ncbi:MAG: hypothetical protein ACI9K3_001015 [Halovenus sp.]|jgi:hypothetical protein
MENTSNKREFSTLSRRQWLATVAGVGTTGLAGCIDTVLNRADESAEEVPVTNRDVSPAALFVGDPLPDRALTEADYTTEEFEILVSGESLGIESSAELYGSYISSLVKSGNHNGSRVDRMADIRGSDATSEEQRWAQALYDYLDGEATVCERFVVTVPDARLRNGDETLATQVTPSRLLRAMTGETIGPEPQGEDSSVFQWESAVPRLSARISYPWPPVETTGPFSPHETLLAAGGANEADSPIINIGPLLDPTRNDNEYDGVSIADGVVTGFAWDKRGSWGEETRLGATAHTPMLVAPVFAQPENGPEPIPALLFVQRIRHEDQCIYVGGWTINDNALYQNATTILAAEAAPELPQLSLERPDMYDETELRRAILSSFDTERCDERCQLGSVIYDGELGRNGTLSEAVEQFLPTAYRGGSTRKRLANEIWESAGDRDGRAPVNGTVVAANPPVVHINYARYCWPCSAFYCFEYCPTTNLVPAVNTISRR